MQLKKSYWDLGCVILCWGFFLLLLNFVCWSLCPAIVLVTLLPSARDLKTHWETWVPSWVPWIGLIISSIKNSSFHLAVWKCKLVISAVRAVYFSSQLILLHEYIPYTLERATEPLCSAKQHLHFMHNATSHTAAPARARETLQQGNCPNRNCFLFTSSQCLTSQPFSFRAYF